MTNNFWLGANELCIVPRSGTYGVVEKYEGWEDVFQGSYERCRKYCEDRVTAWEESVIG